MRCFQCPRRCGVDRSKAIGLCRCGDLPRIAKAALHFYEEPCISGQNGSGAVFFSGCNLDCIFCQNEPLKSGTVGVPANAEQLAEQFLLLQKQNAENINLVTPSPHTAVIREAIILARKAGLSIPIVYNTSAYELPETLRILEGLVDIYLPDFKYVSDELAVRFSHAPRYCAVAEAAIGEMYRQVGSLVCDQRGMAQKGILLRHLVLPGCIDDTRRVLDRINAILPPETHLSLMRQYVPYRDDLPFPLNRRVTNREYARAVRHCIDIGFQNVLIQSSDAADTIYTPVFTEHQ